MTRINTIDPQYNTTQNLLAEWRELTRVPNKIKSGRTKLNKALPSSYCIRSDDYNVGGAGHELFFVARLKWLQSHYEDILLELEKRGYPQTNNWPSEVNKTDYPFLYSMDYTPSKRDYVKCIQRIYERFRDSNKKHYMGTKDNKVLVQSFDELYNKLSEVYELDAFNITEAWFKYV